MQTNKYEHVFPLLKTCDFSPLEHKASRVLDDYSLSPWVFSPPIDMIKLWCDPSLPLWHQFPRRVLLDFCHEWVWSLSHRTKQQVECDAGRGQGSLSGAGSRRMQKQVASCLSCSEIGDTVLFVSVVPKGFGWTEGIRPVRSSSSQRKHLSPQLTRQVRSHKDLQGINWKICNELDAENAEQIEKKEI